TKRPIGSTKGSNKRGGVRNGSMHTDAPAIALDGDDDDDEPIAKRLRDTSTTSETNTTEKPKGSDKKRKLAAAQCAQMHFYSVNSIEILTSYLSEIHSAKSYGQISNDVTARNPLVWIQFKPLFQKILVAERKLTEWDEQRIRGWGVDISLDSQQTVASYDDRPHLVLATEELYILRPQFWLNNN
ncbi:hypothetical protein S245_063057, partial [Arachis hypogaea]